MRRRGAALILCVLLAVQLLLPSARAADRVYFTAVGTYVLPLSDNTMPFWSGGYVYIPSSVFTGTGREALGVSRVQDETDQGWVVLYSGSSGRSLTFKLSDNCALDNEGGAHYPGAIRRNGLVFVPANTVSRYFGLSYSVIEVDRGSMVWLRQQSFTLSDKLFASAAQYNMNSVYSDYIRAKESAQPEGGLSEQPKPPAASEIQDPADELDGKRIALCLKGGDAFMADALSGCGAAFFFTPEEMEQQGDTLRRLVAEGKSVGILADGGDRSRTVSEQLEAGNAALFRATCGKTRLAYIQNGGSQAVQSAEAGGFRCLRPDMEVRSLRTAADAQELVRRLAARRGSLAVWLGDDAGAAGLRALLSAVKEAGGICAAYTETGAA